MSIRQLIVIISFGLWVVDCFAQESASDTIPDFTRDCVLQSSGYFNPYYPTGYGEAEPGTVDTLIVFSATTTVRKKPAVDGEVITKLQIGHIVFVRKVVEEKSTIEGVEAPWCEVDLNGQKGYIWTGALTRGFVQLGDNSFVCWGLAKITNNKDDYAKIASVRRFRDGAVLQRLDIDISRSSYEGSSGELHLWCAPDLEGVENILVLSTYGEACGVYSTSNFIAWDGETLSFIASGFGMGDGGVLYESLDIVLPYPTFATEEQQMTLYQYPKENQFLINESEGFINDEGDWEEHSKVKLFSWPSLEKTSWD